ncbi:MAG: DUF448 domain-containing protein [Sandaracinaceae bacterium]|nr:DUF448 domain-containing protein [Sandaracinaceae bacterium]
MPESKSERMCIGCLNKSHPNALIRLVFVNSPPYVAPDLVPRGTREFGGRGAWVHPRWQCVRKVSEKGQLARSLRQDVRIDGKWLAQAIQKRLEKRAEGLLLAARRKKALTIGIEVTQLNLQEGRVALVAIPSGVTHRNAKLLEWALHHNQNVLILPFTPSTDLGKLLSHPEVKAVGILDAQIASELKESVQRWFDLAEAE